MKKVLLIALILSVPSISMAFEEGDVLFGPAPGYAARGAIKGGGAEFYYFISPKTSLGPTASYYILKLTDDDWETRAVPAQFGMRYYFYQMIFLGLGGFYTFHLETDTGDNNDKVTEYNTYGPYLQFGFSVEFENFYFDLYSQFFFAMSPYLEVNNTKYSQMYGIAYISAGVKLNFGSKKQ